MIRAMGSATPNVRVDVGAGGAVWWLVLNRAAKLNALDEDIRIGLQDAVDRVAERADVRVVVLAGAGRAFSAGADLHDRPRARTSAPLARLHGHVIGGAALLAAACDLRVGADDVTVAIPEVALGIPLTWAGLPRLAREIGVSRTRDLVMTGRSLGAGEAEAWGYLHRVVGPDQLDETVEALPATLAAQPADALAMTVDALRALGRAVSAPEMAWADPDLLRWSLRDGRRR